jgi:hypothetical protein
MKNENHYILDFLLRVTLVMGRRKPILEYNNMAQKIYYEAEEDKKKWVMSGLKFGVKST